MLKIFLSHVEQAVVQNTLDAVLRTQNTGNIGIFQCRINHAVGTGVDDRSRAAGLADNACAFEFTHGNLRSLPFRARCRRAR